MWREVIRRLIRILSGEDVDETLPPPTPINWYVTSVQKIRQWLHDNKLEHIICRDNWYWGTDIDTWRDWAFESLQGCPEYQTETATQRGFDCDDFAEEFVAYCKRTHKANGIWAVVGWTPQGYHAWVVVEENGEKYEFEPQTGEVWVYGTNPDYQADKRL